MKGVKQGQFMALTYNIWHVVLNLMYVPDETRSLLTEELPSRDDIRQMAEDNNDVMLKAQLDRCELFEAFWLGDHDLVVHLMKSSGADNGFYERINTGMHGMYALYAQCALSSITVARRSNRRQKRKYINIALKFARKIRKWVKKGVSTTL
jgi:hypothetical protein